MSSSLPWPISYVSEQHWFWRDCAGFHEPLFFALLRHNGFPYDATHKPYGHIKRFWSIVFQLVFICSGFTLHLSPLLCFIAILNIIYILLRDFIDKNEKSTRTKTSELLSCIRIKGEISIEYNKFKHQAFAIMKARLFKYIENFTSKNLKFSDKIL